ncbi:MAG: hypothetical protein WB688_21350 [Trebonia sp.]
MIEETFAGLRFVGNQMGYHLDPADFLQPEKGHPGHSDVTSWGGDLCLVAGL